MHGLAYTSRQTNQRGRKAQMALTSIRSLIGYLPESV